MNAMMLRPSAIPALFAAGVEPEPEPRLSVAGRLQAREALFQTSWSQRAMAWLRAGRQAVAGGEAKALLVMADMLLRDRLAQPVGLPQPELALNWPDGLCGLAPDLSPTTLIEAQALGLLARAPFGPATWWAPARRRIVDPARLTVSGAARRCLTRTPVRLVLDAAFAETAARTLAPVRQGARFACRQAMTSALLHAHAALYDAGFAHTFQVVDEQGRSQAGGWGVAVGSTFLLRGVFCEARGMDEVALVLFGKEIASRGFALLDAGDALASAERLGFRQVSREAHARLVANALERNSVGRWRATPPTPLASDAGPDERMKPWNAVA